MRRYRRTSTERLADQMVRDVARLERAVERLATAVGMPYYDLYKDDDDE